MAKALEPVKGYPSSSLQNDALSMKQLSGMKDMARIRLYGKPEKGCSENTSAPLFMLSCTMFLI